MEYAKVSGKNVVIKLPIDLLVAAFNDSPHNYDDIKIKFKRKFAQAFADKINNTSTNSESGLTVFQEWIDEIFIEMIEEDTSYIKFPK